MIFVHLHDVFILLLYYNKVILRNGKYNDDKLEGLHYEKGDSGKHGETGRCHVRQR